MLEKAREVWKKQPFGIANKLLPQRVFLRNLSQKERNSKSIVIFKCHCNYEKP